MDSYIRLFDAQKRNEGDGPTIGLILCAEKNEAVARYSILHEHEQLFAAKYVTYLPSVEELERELARDRRMLKHATTSRCRGSSRRALAGTPHGHQEAEERPRARKADREGNPAANDDKRRNQARRVRDVVSRFDLARDRVVVAGDLNDTPEGVPCASCSRPRASTTLSTSCPKASRAGPTAMGAIRSTTCSCPSRCGGGPEAVVIESTGQ